MTLFWHNNSILLIRGGLVATEQADLPRATLMRGEPAGSALTFYGTASVLRLRADVDKTGPALFMTSCTRQHRGSGAGCRPSAYASQTCGRSDKA